MLNFTQGAGSLILVSGSENLKVYYGFINLQKLCQRLTKKIIQ